eukprot:scaffold187974_cov43-Tisochrysis_lutea.AAC.1
MQMIVAKGGRALGRARRRRTIRGSPPPPRVVSRARRVRRWRTTRPAWRPSRPAVPAAARRSPAVS